MKKLALVLAILLLAAPAMADVTITVVDRDGVDGPGLVADINYSGELARAFALEITVDAGTIEDINNYHVGECTVSDKGYGIFMGTIDIASDGTVADYGTPIAPNDAPDAAGTGLGTDTVILEMGSLYEGTNSPATSGTLCSLIVSEGCTMSIAENSTRGAVVLENATPATTVLIGGDIDDGGGEPGPCDGKCYQGPDCNEWIAVGEPASWCYPRQCYGDADNAQNGNPKDGYFWVWSGDLNALIAGWKQPYGGNPATQTWISADFNHGLDGNPKDGYFHVWSSDLNILIANWKQADVNETTDCNTPTAPTYLPKITSEDLGLQYGLKK